jgi:glycosyltransferase involved in cell wall biosynthesis
MRIAYPMRVDVLDKPGGDLIQVQKYIAGGRGTFNGGNQRFFGQILTDPEQSLNDFDIVHITNLDRPVDTYAAYRAAKAARKKIVFSTIHHSYKEIEKYHLLGVGGLRGFLTGTLGFRIFDIAGTIARSQRYPGLRSMLVRSLRRGIAQTQTEMLTGVDRLLVLTMKERMDIERDCPGSAGLHYEVLPNGMAEMSDYATSATSAERDIDICVVGRIEGRKNQVRVLEALEMLGLSGAFIGAENPYHERYCAAFKECIASSRSKYLGSLTHSETMQIMQRSRVHVSASWFEVLSLVDIEAFFLGCRIVSSRCGGTQEVLGKQCEYVDPASIDSVCSAIRIQLERSHEAELAQEIPLKLMSWQEVTERLADVYQEVLG